MAAVTMAAVTACETVPADDGGSPRQVTVVGFGIVQGTPDTLTADFGIVFTAPDVTSAMNQTSERTAMVIDSLVELGAERKDISTSNVDVQPVYASADVTTTDGTGTATGTADGTGATVTATAVPAAPAIVEYTATNSLVVKIRDAENAPQILARAIFAGADATRLNSVQYSFSDDSQLVQDARANAFNDAKARAQQFAELSQLQLGQVVSISEAAGADPVPSAPRATVAEVPLEPGQQTVSFTVTVVWELT